MNLGLVEREGSVKPYSVDLLCRDPSEQTNVAVESQLEQTDHDHLVKLLTDAAHFEADVAVWIARTFTEQHRAALDWLNKCPRLVLASLVWRSKCGESATPGRHRDSTWWRAK